MHWLDKWESEQESKSENDTMRTPNVNVHIVRVPPIGPFQVVGIDRDDDTYLLFDTGIAAKFDGYVPPFVWVRCNHDLELNRVYAGGIAFESPMKIPDFFPAKYK